MIKRKNAHILILLFLAVLSQAVPVLGGDDYITDSDGIWVYALHSNEAVLESVTVTLYGETIIPHIIDGYTVTGIGFAAFEAQSEITALVFPDSLRDIGDNAFYACAGLTSVTLPKGITRIGANPFGFCDALMFIRVSEGNTMYTDHNGILYNVDGTLLIAYPAGLACHYDVLYGTERIGPYAFEGCLGLTGVILPQSIREIGEYAFYSCLALNIINIPQGVTIINGHTFGQCVSLEKVILPVSVTEIGGCAFYNCESLSDIVLPNHLSKIGFYAFYGCESLTSLTIPDEVTAIGEYAFCGCVHLESLIIPPGVREIGENAFLDCPSLTLTVAENSFAAEYALAHDIPTVFFEHIGDL